MSLRKAAIVNPLRTPIGRFLGALKTLPAEKLASHIISAVVARTQIDPEVIDEVILAQSYANSEAPCIGRWAALDAGLSIKTPGFQIDRRCGGGLQAIASAAMMIQTGSADVVLAGGVESMSNVEYYTSSMREGARAGTVKLHDRLERGRERSQPVERFGVISGMIETAENLAREFNISRIAADELAADSHAKAKYAWEQNLFDNEIVSINAPQARGEDITVQKDEGVRPDVTVEKLGALKPMLEGGVVTAGNSSQQNDAAAACLVIAEDKLPSLNLEPLAYFNSWAAAGCEPATMGIGPVPAVERLFSRTGVQWDDIDLIELNEAFAVQVLAVTKSWGMQDLSRINVNGSGISLGHPIGATGARIMTSMLYELERINGKFALETMCIGGGQGIAALFERP